MTKKSLKLSWEETGYGNFLLKKNGWVVSYNPDTQASMGLSPYGFLNDFPIAEITGKQESTIETSLKIDDNDFILNGDWRKEYEKLETKEDALAFYESKKAKFQSPWSEDN